MPPANSYEKWKSGAIPGVVSAKEVIDTAKAWGFSVRSAPHGYLLSHSEPLLTETNGFKRPYLTINEHGTVQGNVERRSVQQLVKAIQKLEAIRGNNL